MKQKLLLKTAMAILLLLPLLIGDGINLNAQSMNENVVAKNAKAIPSTSSATSPKAAVAVSATALKNFKNEFGSVNDVDWTLKSDHSTASFNYSESRVVAYFNADGEFVGSARNRLYSQTPLHVIWALDKKYPGSAPYEIVEWSTPDGTFYVTRLETAKHELKLKVYDSGGIEVLKKKKK